MQTKTNGWVLQMVKLPNMMGRIGMHIIHQISGYLMSRVYSAAIDPNGTKWFGTNGGLIKYDGITWTVYTSKNSGLPDNDIESIAIESNGDKWIGTWNGGIAKYNGTNWTVFKTTNSGLTIKQINSIAIEPNGTKWIGTNSDGLIKYDGTNWTNFNTGNSILPDKAVLSIAIEANGVKWFGTKKGLVKYDGTNWKLYTTSNSGLPDNNIETIAFELNGNKWFGTDKGVAVFNENGVATAVEKVNVILPAGYSLSQNYPNPFNPSTTIKYSVPRQSNVAIKIYDALAREVATLVNEEKSAGNYEVKFNGALLPSGVYFYRINSGEFTETKKLLLMK